MSRLDTNLVTHQLNVKEGSKPIRQAARNFMLELEVQIKQEIQKLLVIDCIKPI